MNLSQIARRFLGARLGQADSAKRPLPATSADPTPPGPCRSVAEDQEHRATLDLQGPSPGRPRWLFDHETLEIPRLMQLFRAA